MFIKFSTLQYQQHKPKSSLPKSRLIIGRKPLLEALQEAKNIEKIFILQTATGEEVHQIKQLARELSIAVSLVPVEKLNRFTAKNHQGVVAIAGLITYQPLQEVISKAFDDGKSPLIVVLDGVTDTRNLGAIARSAHCYGADALVVTLSNSAPITEDAVKTSAGALEHLPICKMASIEQTLDVLHLNGIHTIASTLETDQTIDTLDLNIPVAIVLGAEDKGVSRYVLKHAGNLAYIPMTNNFDSLNVSVASGIIFYEIFRQRNLNK